jgi:hypothetical protein
VIWNWSYDNLLPTLAVKNCYPTVPKFERAKLEWDDAKAAVSQQSKTMIVTQEIETRRPCNAMTARIVNYWQRKVTTPPTKTFKEITMTRIKNTHTHKKKKTQAIVYNISISNKYNQTEILTTVQIHPR